MAVNIGKNQANAGSSGALNLEDFSGGSSGGAGGSRGKKKIIYAVVAALVLAVAIGGFSAYKHDQEIKQNIRYVVEKLEEAAGSSFYATKPDYPPRSEKGGLAFKAGGRFDQLKDNKKLADAIVDKLHGLVYSSSEDGSPSVSYTKLRKAYRIAAVLEYLDYENEAVKAELDEATRQALVAAQEGNWSTKKNAYQDLLPYQGLTYYTGAQQLEKSVIEAAYSARWQEVRQEMSGGKADLGDFLDDLYETASISPIAVPQTVSAVEGPETANPVNEVYIPEPAVNISNIIPMAELKAALQQYGEQAIFRSGQGGYYDQRRDMSSAYSVNNNSTYGDFRRQYISGRVRRTGNEDEFTEKYLQQHYDKPSTTNYYYKDEKINKLPPLFNDTREVYVYNKNAYAFTDYAVYFGSQMLSFDYEAAKEQEFKHMDLNQADSQTAAVEQELAPFMREFALFSPTYQYDLENSLVTIYMQALPGTTEALRQAAGNVDEALLPFGEDTTVKWSDLRKSFTNLTSSLKLELDTNYLISSEVGVGLILISDVNPDAGLLSILNDEVVQDNSADPPAPAEAAPEAEAPETAE